MPALSAKQHDSHVKAYFQHLVDNGKKPLQGRLRCYALVLHAIHGILKHNKSFDNTRFLWDYDMRRIVKINVILLDLEQSIYHAKAGE